MKQDECDERCHAREEMKLKFEMEDLGRKGKS